MVNRRSNTDLGNTQSAPRGGERATVCSFCLRMTIDSRSFSIHVKVLSNIHGGLFPLAYAWLAP